MATDQRHVARFHDIEIALDELEALCRRFYVQELALFGSVLRDDFQTESDIDVLVEYVPVAKIGFFEHLDLQDELEAVFGRKVDLVPKAGLKNRIKQSVLDSSRVLYAA